MINIYHKIFNEFHYLINYLLVYLFYRQRSLTVLHIYSHIYKFNICNITVFV
jgi:hypothetical protein